MVKKKLTMKDVKKDPLLSAFAQAELVHQMPSSILIELKSLIEYELKDREYLKKKSWMERLFDSMGRGKW